MKEEEVMVYYRMSTTACTHAHKDSVGVSSLPISNLGVIHPAPTQALTVTDLVQRVVTRELGVIDM